MSITQYTCREKLAILEEIECGEIGIMAAA